MMKFQHVMIAVSVMNFIRDHGHNIATFQCFLYLKLMLKIVTSYILQKSNTWVIRQGLFFFNLRFYVEMLMNWNGKVVIKFNHEECLSNLSFLCDVNQHLT